MYVCTNRNVYHNECIYTYVFYIYEVYDAHYTYAYILPCVETYVNAYYLRKKFIIKPIKSYTSLSSLYEAIAGNFKRAIRRECEGLSNELSIAK